MGPCSDFLLLRFPSPHPNIFYLNGRRAQIVHITARFRDVDVARRGFIELVELERILPPGVSEEEIDALVDRFDAAHAGRITLALITRAMFELELSGMFKDLADMKRLFDSIDASGSGAISSAELRRVLHHVSDTDFARLEAEFDANHDGVFDWGEIAAMHPRIRQLEETRTLAQVMEEEDDERIPRPMLGRSFFICSSVPPAPRGDGEAGSAAQRRCPPPPACCQLCASGTSHRIQAAFARHAWNEELSVIGLIAAEAADISAGRIGAQRFTHTSEKRLDRRRVRDALLSLGVSELMYPPARDASVMVTLRDVFAKYATIELPRVAAGGREHHVGGGGGSAGGGAAAVDDAAALAKKVMIARRKSTLDPLAQVKARAHAAHSADGNVAEYERRKQIALHHSGELLTLMPESALVAALGEMCVKLRRAAPAHDAVEAVRVALRKRRMELLFDDLATAKAHTGQGRLTRKRLLMLLRSSISSDTRTLGGASLAVSAFLDGMRAGTGSGTPGTRLARHVDRDGAGLDAKLKSQNAANAAKAGAAAATGDKSADANDKGVQWVSAQSASDVLRLVLGADDAERGATLFDWEHVRAINAGLALPPRVDVWEFRQLFKFYCEGLEESCLDRALATHGVLRTASKGSMKELIDARRALAAKHGDATDGPSRTSEAPPPLLPPPSTSPSAPPSSYDDGRIELTHRGFRKLVAAHWAAMAPLHGSWLAMLAWPRLFIHWILSVSIIECCPCLCCCVILKEGDVVEIETVDGRGVEVSRGWIRRINLHGVNVGWARVPAYDIEKEHRELTEEEKHEHFNVRPIKHRLEMELNVFGDEIKKRKCANLASCAALVTVDNFILIVIIASAVLLAVESPLWSNDAPQLWYMGLAELVINVIFTLETMLKVRSFYVPLHYISCASFSQLFDSLPLNIFDALPLCPARRFFKMVAYGAVFAKPWRVAHSYIGDPWNVLDLVIVAISWATYLLSDVAEFKSLRVLRLLRVLRVLRTLNKFPGLKHVVAALLKSVVPLLNVVPVILLFFLIFAIVCMSYLSGDLRACVGPAYGALSDEQQRFVFDPTLGGAYPDGARYAELTAWMSKHHVNGSAALDAWGSANGTTYAPSDRLIAVGSAQPVTSRVICEWLGASWEPVVPQNFDNVVNSLSAFFQVSLVI